MKHGKKYSGGYDYKAIREYETNIEKHNELKRSLEPSNRPWAVISVIVFASLCIIALIAVKVHSVWFESRLRSEVSIFLKIRSANEDFLVSNGFEADRNSIDPYPQSGNIIQTLVSSGRLEYEDFFSPILERSIMFRKCDDILLGHLCAGFSQDAGAVVTALNAHAWPPKDTPSISAAPVRYACVFEVLHDDKNYYDGLGKSKASVDKKLPPLCAEESMKPDLIGEFDYIVGMGKL